MKKRQLGLLDYRIDAQLSSLGGVAGEAKNTNYRLVQGDARELLGRLPPECVDLMFADPPYFLSNGGTTCRSGERVEVDKGEWDASGGLVADEEFQAAWLAEARRVLKPTGTLWVSGTHHNIFTVGHILQRERWHILNTITWFKPNASPNLGCRQFTHSTELIIWAAPAEREPLPHTFNYVDMKEENGGKQMRDVWTIPPPKESEKKHGRHPTQKPLALLDRIVRASSNPGDLVVDPFTGSGTTGVAATRCGRKFLGIEQDAEHFALAERRIRDE